MTAQEYSRAIQNEIAKNLAAAQRLTADVAGQLQARSGYVQALVEMGEIAEVIINKAREERADLIVLGSRGLSSARSFLLGSISYKVATYAPCSVLIVKKRIRRLKRILIAVDGSPHSRHAVRFLRSHFRPDGMEATVLNVWSLSFPLPKSLVATVEEQYSRELAEVGFKARARSERGHPATVILESAQRQHAQLLVVGARGLSGLKRFLLGSVSHRIVKYSASSVLVVKES